MTLKRCPVTFQSWTLEPWNPVILELWNLGTLLSNIATLETCNPGTIRWVAKLGQCFDGAFETRVWVGRFRQDRDEIWTRCGRDQKSLLSRHCPTAWWRTCQGEKHGKEPHKSKTKMTRRTRQERRDNRTMPAPVSVLCSDCSLQRLFLAVLVVCNGCCWRWLFLVVTVDFNAVKTLQRGSIDFHTFLTNTSQ